MSKAILVMDMPTHCAKCPCFYESAHDMCGAMNKRVNLNSKPEWCPLREVPQKQVNNCLDNTYQRGAKDGWNFCISEILKGSE